MSRLTESCLILTRSLKRGEEEAWTRFHTAYYEFILGAARRFSNDHHVAQDLAQQTFLRLVRHMKVFEDYGDFENWIRCLIRCVYIDYVRRSVRRSGLLEKFMNVWEMHQPDPVSVALQADRIEALLSSLNESDRALVTAFYLSNQNQREIALNFGMTVRAVESRLGRIRKSLRLL